MNLDKLTSLAHVCDLILDCGTWQACTCIYVNRLTCLHTSLSCTTTAKVCVDQRATYVVHWTKMWISFCKMRISFMKGEGSSLICNSFTLCTQIRQNELQHLVQRCGVQSVQLLAGPADKWAVIHTTPLMIPLRGVRHEHDYLLVRKGTKHDHSWLLC